MRSSLEKSKVSLNFALAVVAVFLSFRLMETGTEVNGFKLGVVINERHIGVAAASYWLMGGKPKINSMVRNIEEVEYMVWSTKPRLTCGPAT